MAWKLSNNINFLCRLNNRSLLFNTFLNSIIPVLCWIESMSLIQLLWSRRWWTLLEDYHPLICLNKDKGNLICSKLIKLWELINHKQGRNFHLLLYISLYYMEASLFSKLFFCINMFCLPLLHKGIYSNVSILLLVHAVHHLYPGNISSWFSEKSWYNIYCLLHL